jgi:hypothetical protein
MVLTEPEKIETPQLTKGTLKGLFGDKCPPIHRESTNDKRPKLALYL